jgi:hypothetical protein
MRTALLFLGAAFLLLGGWNLLAAVAGKRTAEAAFLAGLFVAAAIVCWALATWGPAGFRRRRCPRCGRRNAWRANRCWHCHRALPEI